ncbi:MAG: hypothetical protein JNK25_00745 [Phycisphaerae bacterium]|nr:hypothetical protein [Phycisphaerae bacterium]
MPTRVPGPVPVLLAGSVLRVRVTEPLAVSPATASGTTTAATTASPPPSASLPLSE